MSHTSSATMRGAQRGRGVPFVVEPGDSRPGCWSGLAGVPNVARTGVAVALTPDADGAAARIDVELEVVAVGLEEAVARCRELVREPGHEGRDLRLVGPGRAAVGRRAVIDVPACIRVAAAGVV